MRRIDEVWMCRAEVSGELVQSVMSNKDTGRDVQRTVLSIEFLNGGAAAARVTFAKDFLKIAVQKLNNSITHRSIPCQRSWCRLGWKTGFDPNETSRWFFFSGCQTAQVLLPSVTASKVRSCFEFASDLRDVAALKARARKFVLRRHAAAVRLSDRGCAIRRTAANLIHGALPLE
jgi:hypothetical protein